MKRSNLLYFPIALTILALSFFQSCLSDQISSDPELNIKFSRDTLTFDTVFTTVGSATRSFKILNNNNEDVALSSISLENGAQSMFRLNVDGLPGQTFSDIRVPANDSIWVFAEVTVDPDLPLSISPFVIEDKFLVTVNGNQSHVQLEAFGQNANYITSASNIGRGQLICEIGEIVNWNDPKPYIIYGIVGIQNCRVNIAPGTRIHVHGGIVNDSGTIRNDGILIVDVNGSIHAEGTLENPIIIQGDRLEEAFQDVAGQWGGIILASGSNLSTFNHVEIKNSIVGISADSATDLRISNSKIYQTAGSGIQARFADIDASNLLIHSNNTRCLDIQFGGNYNFDHCTMANYLNSDEAVLLANFTCRNADCDIIEIRRLNAVFNNCVIAGNESDEVILLDGQEPSQFNFSFNNSAIQIEDLLDTYPNLLTDNCNGCFVINRNDTLFRDESRLDFHPDTLSTLINKAVFNNNFPLDLDGVTRMINNTDIGCYEFVPEM